MSYGFGLSYPVESKLKQLRWTKDETEFFLNCLYDWDTTKLVDTLLHFADTDWIKQTADDLGTFETNEDDDEEQDDEDESTMARTT